MSADQPARKYWESDLSSIARFPGLASLGIGGLEPGQTVDVEDRMFHPYKR